MWSRFGFERVVCFSSLSRPYGKEKVPEGADLWLWCDGGGWLDLQSLLEKKPWGCRGVKCRGWKGVPSSSTDQLLQGLLVSQRNRDALSRGQGQARACVPDRTHQVTFYLSGCPTEPTSQEHRVKGRLTTRKEGKSLGINSEY